MTVNYKCFLVLCVPLISIPVDLVLIWLVGHYLVDHDDDGVRLKCSGVTEPVTLLSDGVASDI